MAKILEAIWEIIKKIPEIWPIVKKFPWVTISIVLAGLLGYGGYRYYLKHQTLMNVHKEKAALYEKLSNEIGSLRNAIHFLQMNIYELSREMDDGHIPTPGVTVFAHRDFLGKRFLFKAGDYGEALTSLWFNDMIGSIKLTGNVRAVMYADSNFLGDFLPVEDSISDLALIGWNGRISSLRVIPK
jgi:hypothetical protein